MKLDFGGAGVIATFFLVVTLFAAGCGMPQDPIRLGTNVWPGYEPLYLARDTGLLDTEKIRLVGYPSASEVIRAFRNHSLEAASLTLDEALLLLDKGLPIRGILVHDVSRGADAILARPGIEQVTDLRGQRIAVESSALGAYIVTRALQEHSLDLEAVEIRHLDVNQHEAAYAAGEVDAAVTFEPFLTHLKALGAQEIFNSSEIPGEIIDVLVVHEDIFETRLQDLKGLAQSWFAALDYMQREPGKSAAIMAKRLKMDRDKVLDSFQGIHLPTREENISMLDGGQEKILKLARIMRKHDLVSRDLVVPQLLSSDALH